MERVYILFAWSCDRLGGEKCIGDPPGHRCLGSSIVAGAGMRFVITGASRPLLSG